MDTNQDKDMTQSGDVDFNKFSLEELKYELDCRRTERKEKVREIDHIDSDIVGIKEIIYRRFTTAEINATIFGADEDNKKKPG